MRYSKLFGKTVKQAPSEAGNISTKLLYQGGFIRESTAGRYFMLPLGQKVQQKIIGIVKEEMDKAGAQEMLAPVLHPIELWQETNRTNTAGFELTTVTDRRKAQFALGGTAEEMFVDVVRKFQLSYKDLPINLYQFSNKFRDELRARGGLLRVREFIMKDAYSFHESEADFKKEYAKMRETYLKIFARCGLKTVVVESDNGYIGGEYCHEFVVEAESGESKFLMNEDGSYAAHEDVAKFDRYIDSALEDHKERQDVLGKGIIGVADLAKFLSIPVEKTTKTILFEADNGQVVAAAINGIYDINETKLKNILHTTTLKLASPEVVRQVTGAEVGYAGILNLPKSVKVVMDISLEHRTNFECGANKTDYHSININFGRDLPLPEKFYDIGLAKDGYPHQGQKLVAKKGIEVGNIFQLGFHYSKLMKRANFINTEGQEKPFYMGCYGIGLCRSLATIVEVSADNFGILWPEAVAPYQVHLVGLDLKDEDIKKKVENVYKTLLEKGIDVLFDDREEVSAGAKFADADLIGIPHRLVVSKRSGEMVEYKKRGEKESRNLQLTELISSLAI